MNYKLLRKQADLLCVEWLKTMVPEGEEADRITVQSMPSMLPDETHLYAGGQVRLHAMTPKWIYKQLKKNPDITLEELMR